MDSFYYYISVRSDRRDIFLNDRNPASVTVSLLGDAYFSSKRGWFKEDCIRPMWF
jgi:hypothetical protein